MRRIRTAVFAATALVALIVVSVAAAAALNTYTGSSIIANQSGAGTAQKPVALGLVQKLAVKPAVTGNVNADPLVDIKLTLPKVKVNYTGFPVCTAATVAGAQTDAGCPKGALVATGNVTAALWNRKTPTAAGIPCDPVLDVWNAGSGKLTYFFKIPAGHQCAGLATGAVAPWTGTIKQSGTSVVQDTPLPPPVSTNAGNLGLFSSLEAETLTYSKLTAKVGGKTVPFLQSVGCVLGKRPFTLGFTATDGSTKSVSTVTGAGKC